MMIPKAISFVKLLILNPFPKNLGRRKPHSFDDLDPQKNQSKPETVTHRQFLQPRCLSAAGGRGTSQLFPMLRFVFGRPGSDEAAAAARS
jgi:hypothetical protein